MAMLYPKGNYKVSIRQWGLGRSAEKKTPFFFMKCRPTHFLKDLPSGEVEEVELDAEQAEIVDINIWLTEKTIGQAKSKLQFIGFTGKSLKELNPDATPETDGVEPFDFSKIVFVANCDHEEYPVGSGKQKPRWDVSRAKAHKMSNDELAHLADLFDHKFAPDPDANENQGTQTG